MKLTERDDPVWQAAWSWVQREHEKAMDAFARVQLDDWLQADAAHRRAYEEACSLWLLAGLVSAKRVGAGGAGGSST
jgi:ferric-dicitrate binding protein FerR (iron transport regulator)